MKRTPDRIPGWTLIKRSRISSLPLKVQYKVEEKGSSFTVKLNDRHLRYVNDGFVIASTEEEVISVHRRFRTSKLKETPE